MKIVFTDRAYISILAETAEKIQTETGGIFLGYRCGEVWYVMESIDPGPKSIFEVAYFEYDYKYVNHLSNKVARLYKKPLEMLGLWHRHPGSFDQFSGTDDGTNKKFSSLNKAGAISALVNIDPEFRLTVFHVGLPLHYTRVSYAVGDSLLPEEIKGYCNTQRLLDYLSAKESTIWGNSKQRQPRYKYSEIIDNIINNLSSIDVTQYVKDEQIPVLTDEDISFLLSQIEEDIEFFGDCYLTSQMSLQNKHIRVTAKDEIRLTFDFCITPDDHRCMFSYRGKYFLYTPKLFKVIISDVIEAKQRKRVFFTLNREFVECSIRKLRKN